MKAPLLDELKIRVRGVPPLERLAGLMVASLQMRHLKISLNYMGEGAWQACRGEVRPTWDALCRAQVDFTEATERNLHDCVRTVKARLQKAGSDEARAILELMATPPAELSDEDRGRLLEGIRLHALREGDTQKILRDEVSTDAEVEPPPEVLCRMLEVTCHGGRSDKYRRKLVAVGMACGLSENRAGEVADYMIHRRTQEHMRLVSVAMDMHRNGRLPLSILDDNTDERREEP